MIQLVIYSLTVVPDNFQLVSGIGEDCPNNTIEHQEWDVDIYSCSALCFLRSDTCKGFVYIHDSTIEKKCILKSELCTTYVPRANAAVYARNMSGSALI